MRNRFNINESEKNQIRKQHGIRPSTLTEQNIGGWLKNIFKKNKGVDEVEDQEVIDIVDPHDSRIPWCRDTRNYGGWEDASPYRHLPIQERPIGGANLSAVNDVSLVYGFGLWGGTPTTWLYVEKDGKPICKILEMDEREERGVLVPGQPTLRDMEKIKRDMAPRDEMPTPEGDDIDEPLPGEGRG